MDLCITSQDKQGLKAIRRMIEDSGDDLLLEAKRSNQLTDEYLLRFLRSRGYNTESALERVRRLHDVRVIRYPEVFMTFLPSDLQKAFDTVGVDILKQRDPKGRQIMVVKSYNWDPSVLSGDVIFQMIIMAGWECLRTKGTQENGVVVIFDVCSFGLSHTREFSPSFIMKWATIIIKSSPMKLKAMHFVNVHPIFKITLNVIRMFTPRKMRKRIFPHGEICPGFLEEFFSSQILPESLGGDLKEDDAIDYKLIQNLYSHKSEEYYKFLRSATKNRMKNSQ